MAVSPYQISNPFSNVRQLEQQHHYQKGQMNLATTQQKGKMAEEFEQELLEAQRIAKEKAGKNKPWMQLLNLVGTGLGPGGAAAVGAITSGYAGRQKQKGAEKLLDVDFDRWGKTFLKSPSREFKAKAEESQLSSGDVLRGAAGGGLTSWALSNLLSETGDGGEGGLFRQAASDPDKGIFKVFMEQLKDMGNNPEALEKLKGGIMLPGLLRQILGGQYYQE